MPARKTLRSFSRQPGATKAARLARWLVPMLERAAGDLDQTEGKEHDLLASLVADAHVALSGGAWLQRAHGVRVERYLRYRLVECVLFAGKQASAVGDKLAERPSSSPLLMQALAGLALSTFSTFDPVRARRAAVSRSGVVALYAALDAVVRGKGTWDAMLSLVHTMKLGGELSHENSEPLRQDVLRLRRLLRKGLGLRFYRALQPETHLTFAINP